MMKMKMKKEQDEDDEEINAEKKKTIAARICRVCNRGFSSGKALGGHMRIHGQLYKKQSRDENENENEDEDEEFWYEDDDEGDMLKKKKKKKQSLLKKAKMVIPICVICGKDFQSMKSLYGHMRSHPRDWKGIHPPPPSPPDLTKALKSWPVTGKRGRKLKINTTTRVCDQTSGLSEDTEEEQLRGAAHELMMLAHGEEFDSITSLSNEVVVDEHFHWNNRSNDIVLMDNNVGGKRKDLQENQENEGSKRMNPVHWKSDGKQRVSEKSRKKRKKIIKLRDLGCVDDHRRSNLDFDLNELPTMEVETNDHQYEYVSRARLL